MIRLEDKNLARLVQFLLGSPITVNGANGQVSVERFPHETADEASHFYHQVRNRIREIQADGTIQMRLIDTEVIVELHHSGLAVLSFYGKQVLCLANDQNEWNEVQSLTCSHDEIVARIEALAK